MVKAKAFAPGVECLRWHIMPSSGIDWDNVPKDIDWSNPTQEDLFRLYALHSSLPESVQCYYQTSSRTPGYWEITLASDTDYCNLARELSLLAGGTDGLFPAETEDEVAAIAEAVHKGNCAQIVHCLLNASAKLQSGL